MSEDAPQTLPEVFLAAVARGEGRPFLSFEGRRWSYGEMRAAALRAAGSLLGAGLEPGDRIALFLGNSASFVATYLAALSAGLAVVPVNTRYREVELGHMLADSGARLVVTDRDGAEVLPRVAEPELGSVVLEHELDADLDRLNARGGAAPALGAPLPRGPDDLAVIGYTSGTTGRSKGAMLSHRNFVANSRAVTASWRWTGADTLLLVLPLFHMHGLGVGLHGTLVQGSSLRLHRGFEPETVLDELAGGAATLFFGVPTMYHRLLERDRRRGNADPDRFEGLRLLVSGSAPLAPQIHAEVETRFGHRILERYGMTETVMISGNPHDGPRKAGTVGLPFPGVEIRIAAPEGAAGGLAPGETGEIQLRGPNVCRGYWGRPDASAEARSDDGWFRTGDLGYLDDDGYLVINGRAKELIISGGFNVYPREVEEVIAELPGVREVAVVGRSDPDLGERVVAVVVGDATPDAVVDHCRERLAGFKKPREVRTLEALPRNALGKVQKHRVLQLLAEADLA